MVIGHSLDEFSTERRLQRIHDKMKEKLMSNKKETMLGEGKTIQEQKDAKFLEISLNEIINIMKNSSYTSKNIASDAYRLFLSKIAQRLSASSQVGRVLFQQYSTVSSEKGEEFEQDFSQLIMSVFETAKNENFFTSDNIGQNIIQVGKQTANIKGFINLSNTAQQIVRQSYAKVSEYIRDNIKNGDSKEIGIYQAVSGKIDVTGLHFQVDLATGLDKDITRLIKLLNQATFTLKNYNSSDVELGSIGANFYRTFYTAAKLAGEKNIDEGFWRMINCLRYHNSDNEEVRGNIARIRFMYELTGIGQDYRKANITDPFLEKITNQNGARFLVKYDGGTVIVKSTTELLYKRLKQSTAQLLSRKKDINDLLYGGITVHVAPSAE